MEEKEEAKTIKIVADNLKIYGPTVDGGYKLTFSIGEYQKEQLGELLKNAGGERNIEIAIDFIERGKEGDTFRIPKV